MDERTDGDSTTRPFEPFPDVEIFIADGSLPLAAVEEFASQYTVVTGAEVRLTLRWGGPAAGGLGWGGPEIAAIIVLGELLRRGTSEAYDLVKAFILDVYTRIRTRNAARWYIEGALAVAVDSPTAAVRLLFCFPEGLDKPALEERIGLVEEHYAELLGEWESSLAAQSRQASGAAAEIRLCWNSDTAEWVECQPDPQAEEK